MGSVYYTHLISHNCTHTFCTEIVTWSQMFGAKCVYAIVWDKMCVISFSLIYIWENYFLWLIGET